MKQTINHPIQQFSFILVDEISEAIYSEFCRLIEILASSREWTISPPGLLSEEPQTGEDPITGGFLDIYSAIRPLVLPKEIDRQEYSEVEAIVEQLQGFSMRHQIKVDFYLDAVFVGSIEDGDPDSSLQNGLLGEWQRNLEEAAPPERTESK